VCPRKFLYTILLLSFSFQAFGINGTLTGVLNCSLYQLFKSATEFSKLAAQYAKSARINPDQLRPDEFTDGINAFCDYTKAAEKAVDIIPILPQFKFRPNDAIDFLMWNYVNYERNLNGMPDIEYKDMWKEYDTRKENYIKTTGDPYNIFEGDTTESNREKILKFLEMPEDLEHYDEQDTEEGEENFE